MYKITEEYKNGTVLVSKQLSPENFLEPEDTRTFKVMETLDIEELILYFDNRTATYEILFN